MPDFIAIPAIVILCGFFGHAYKVYMPEEKYKRIPILCGAIGGVLGVVCFLFISGYIPADNVLVAAAIGVTSGLAATGGHQVWKQNT